MNFTYLDSKRLIGTLIHNEVSSLLPSIRCLYDSSPTQLLTPLVNLRAISQVQGQCHPIRCKFASSLLFNFLLGLLIPLSMLISAEFSYSIYIPLSAYQFWVVCDSHLPFAVGSSWHVGFHYYSISIWAPVQSSVFLSAHSQFP